MQQPLPMILAMVAASSGCVAGVGPSSDEPHPTAAADAGPGWWLGDHWVQRLYYEDAPDDTVRTIEYYVEASERVNVGATTFDTLRVVSPDTNRTMWVTVGNFSIVREMDGQWVRDFDPPCDAYHASGATGARWNHGCRRIGTFAPGLPDGGNFSSAVEGERTLDVPAGTFATVEIQSSSDTAGDQVEYFAPEACFPARVVVEGARTLVLDLITHQCASRGSPP